MNAELSATDKLLIFHLSGDLGDSPAPYAELAERLGLTEDEVLAAVRRYMETGLIRRLGATLWHQRSGFKANAMVVFEVSSEQAEDVGGRMAEKPYVSHCYLRRTAPGWPYNLYAMIHAEERGQLLAMAEELAAICRGRPWRILESLKELKKISMRYFTPESEE